MQNISQAFANTLREEHQFYCRVVMLDDGFNEVRELVGGSRTNDISNFISDGNVDVDQTRGTRRTAELTILNPTADFTPARDNRGGWAGEIYFNRVVRIYRGAYTNRGPQEVCVGTFMIDSAEIIVERNMSLVNLTLSDLWKKLQKSYVVKDGKTVTSWDKGFSYGTVIRDTIDGTGADWPFSPVIDDLSSRTSVDSHIQDKLQIDEGTSRGDFLKTQCLAWDLDIYFDPKGQLIVQDRKKASDKQVVWTFYSSDDRRGMISNLQRTYNDDNLYNHVVVIGTNANNNPIRREWSDTDANSDIAIRKIGDRVWMDKDDTLKTADQVQRKLDKDVADHYQINETIQCDVICNPALEADDVVHITEKVFSNTDGDYRLQRFNIPMVSSRQTIQCTNIFKFEDWRTWISA